MAIVSNNAADYFIHPDGSVEQNIRPIQNGRQIATAPQYNKDPRLERPAFLDNQREGLRANQSQEFVGPKATKRQLLNNSLKSSPVLRGAAFGAGLSAATGGDPVDMLQGAVEMGVANKGLDMAGKALGKTKYGKAIVSGAKNLAGKIPVPGALATGARFIPYVGAALTAAELGKTIYDAVDDVNNNKENEFVSTARKIGAPIQGLFNYFADDDKKGWQGYLDAVKEEYNDGSKTLEQIKQQEQAPAPAQEQASVAAQQQTPVAAQQQAPAATFEQQSASLAQALAQSVKDNPDNPYAWDAAPGFGAVRGSDGTMKYVVPNEPYDPDKAYEREMRDRAYQYYMDSISMAGSPFATPERRAAELARANSLAQAFGLGLDPNVAAQGSGLRAASNKLDAVSKNMQELALKGEQNKQELLNRLAKSSELQNKDTPEIANAQKAMLLANNDIFGNTDPLNSNEMANVEAQQLNRLGLDRAIRLSGVNDATPNSLQQKHSAGALVYNALARPFGLPKMSKNWYALDKNGEDVKVDLSNANPGELYLAQTYDRINKEARSINEAYNEYRKAEHKKGRQPLSFQQWRQQRGAQ